MNGEPELWRIQAIASEAIKHERARTVAWLHERADDAISKSAILEDKVAGPRLRAMCAWGHQLALGVERGEHEVHHG